MTIDNGVIGREVEKGGEATLLYPSPPLLTTNAVISNEVRNLKKLCPLRLYAFAITFAKATAIKKAMAYKVRDTITQSETTTKTPLN